MITRNSDANRPTSINPASPKRPSGWPAGWRYLLSAEVMAPLLVGLLMLVLWELGVRLFHLPPYLLPGPILVVQTLIQEWSQLFPSLLVTLEITLAAFGLATLSGVLIAILFTQSKWIERSLFPYAVVLQTTPIVAIAPIIK